MAKTPMKNRAKGTVAGLYDAAATSIALSTGEGSRFPSPATEGSFRFWWWNATDYADPADDPNYEICLCPARTSDALGTIVRGQEGTGASVKNIAGKTYKIAAGWTAKIYDDLFTQNLPQTFRGLRLGTHPSADLALRQTLFSADVIVMNDGEAVPNWSNVVTDLTVAGVGGLDTGSEQTATMYKQYALWNGTDQRGCFHRDRDWFLDLDITTGEDASQGIRSAVDNSTVRVSQGITPVTAGRLVMIDVKILKTGTPTGNIWWELQSNSGGVPSNTVLASTWKLDVSRLLTTATVVRVAFLLPASVSASTLYHIVGQGDYTVSATNFVSWRMDGSAASYAGGSKALYDSDTATWTADTDDDLWLRVYIERNNVDFSTTVPAGYRYAHIGYAYNDSAGDLRAFEQHDRSWRLLKPDVNGLIVNEMAAANTLIDLRSYVPALELLTVSFNSTGTGAAGGAVAIGDLSTTDLDIAGVPGKYLQVMYSNSASEVRYAFGTVPVRHAAIMADSTAGVDLYLAGYTW